MTDSLRPTRRASWRSDVSSQGSQSFYPGQSSVQSQIRRHSVEPRVISLDYGFSNGAKFLSFVWFVAIVVLVALFVNLLQTIYLPKIDVRTKICLTPTCAAISKGLTQNMNLSADKCGRDFAELACGNSQVKRKRINGVGVLSTTISPELKYKIMLRYLKQLLNFNQGFKSQYQVLEKMEFLRMAPKLIQKCAQTEPDEDNFFNEREVDQTAQDLEDFAVNLSDHNLTEMLVEAAKYNIYPLFGFNLDRMVSGKDSERKLSMSDIKIVLTPPVMNATRYLFRYSEPFETNVDFISRVFMRLKEKLNYSGRTQDFTATIRALLGRINLAYGAPEFCYGHCSAGSHFRKGVPSLIKLSSTKFGNISKSTLDIEKIQRNLGIPIKEHVEYIYDSAYFEELFKHLSDPEYTKFFKIYVSLEFLVTIGQNLPTSEQRTYLSQNDVYRDSISRCVYHLENVIMWPESAFAAGLAILFFQNFQNNDGIAMEEDFKYVTETLLKRVKEHLERTNQSAEFVENLGFLFLPSGHIYRVLLNFVTLVQQNITSVVDLNVPQNQTRSYFIHLLDAYRVNGLGKILWLTNKDKVVIETSSQVGVTKRKRVMLEPPYAFFPYTDHVETGKKVSPTDEYGERERPWKIHYHCGMHVLQVSMEPLFQPAIHRVNLWVTLLASLGEAVAGTLYELSNNRKVFDFHGFPPISFRQSFSNECFAKVGIKLINLRRTLQRRSLAFTNKDLKGIMFTYFLLTSLTRAPEFNVSQIQPLFRLEDWNAQQLFHVAWMQNFCNPRNESFTHSESAYLKPLMFVNKFFVEDFNKFNCSRELIDDRFCHFA